MPQSDFLDAPGPRDAVGVAKSLQPRQIDHVAGNQQLSPDGAENELVPGRASGRTGRTGTDNNGTNLGGLAPVAELRS